MNKNGEIMHTPRLTLEYLLEPDGCQLLTRLSAQGLTWREMANRLEVPAPDLYSFVTSHPEARRAVQLGTAIVNSEVESALLKRAIGYEYTESTKELAGFDPDTGEGVYKITKEVRKHMAPDVNAIKTWLKKRDPDRWSEDSILNINTIQITAEDKREAAMRAIAEVIESGNIPETSPDAHTDV